MLKERPTFETKKGHIQIIIIKSLRKYPSQTAETAHNTDQNTKQLFISPRRTAP